MISETSYEMAVIAINLVFGALARICPSANDRALSSSAASTPTQTLAFSTACARMAFAGLLPVIRLVVPPAQGKITVKRGRLGATNLKQCLGAEHPAFGYGPLGQARTNGAQDERSSPVIVVANPGICKLWNPRKKNRNGMFCNETLIVGTGPPGRPT